MDLLPRDFIIEFARSVLCLQHISVKTISMYFKTSRFSTEVVYYLLIPPEDIRWDHGEENGGNFKCREIIHG
ncbi:unnamed protein product, partial [Brassica oleracea var. botrytis]